MNRLLTTLLVWLLMATLPLQAVAASVNPSCAPVSHHTGAPSPDQHPVAPAADDAHAHHDGHAVPAGHATAGLDTPGASHVGHGADPDSADLPHSSCSACSVFCVGAVAPPSALLSVPSADGSESVAVALADLVAGFIPDGLQRPPRP